MKSRVIISTPIIISYGLNEKEMEKIDLIAKKVNVKHKAVFDDCLNEQIGYLCEFKSFEKSKEQSIQTGNGKCIIFSGILQKNISAILKEIKVEQLDIPLKAMVTPANQSWKLFELIEELKKEHEFMTSRK